MVMKQLYEDLLIYNRGLRNNFLTQYSNVATAIGVGVSVHSSCSGFLCHLGKLTCRCPFPKLLSKSDRASMWKI